MLNTYIIVLILIAGLKTFVINLDDMPLITELLFIHVLSYMPLKELRINGKKSLKQVCIMYACTVCTDFR